MPWPAYAPVGKRQSHIIYDSLNHDGSLEPLNGAYGEVVSQLPVEELSRVRIPIGTPDGYS